MLARGKGVAASWLIHRRWHCPWFLVHHCLWVYTIAAPRPALFKTYQSLVSVQILAGSKGVTVSWLNHCRRRRPWFSVHHCTVHRWFPVCGWFPVVDAQEEAWSSYVRFLLIIEQSKDVETMISWAAFHCQDGEGIAHLAKRQDKLERCLPRLAGT